RQIRVDVMDDRLAAELGRRFVEHLAEEIETDARDVPRLLGAQEIARAAELEIERSDLEATPELRVALERLDPSAGLFRHRVRGRHDEVAIRAFSASTDAAAELIELREAEEVGAIDDDRVRARDVEPALDDRRRAEDVVLALDEVEHRLLERGLDALLRRAF